IPVEKAQIIALDVVAIVGELDALPLALAAPLAFHEAEEDLARNQLELLELGEEFRVEQRRGRCFRHGGPGGRRRIFRAAMVRLYGQMGLRVSLAPVRPA